MAPVVAKRRGAAWARVGVFCRQVRDARGWDQQDVYGRTSPLTGFPYISRRSYQALENNSSPHETTEARTLRSAELALEIEPGTLDVVLASAEHGLDPKRLGYYRPALDSEGRLVADQSRDGLTDAQRTRAAGRIADAASHKTA